MDNLSKPLAVLFGFKVGKDGLVFIAHNNELRLKMKSYREVFMQILALCNGYRSLGQIRQKFATLSDEQFGKVIEMAKDLGVIVDSRELYLNFHIDSSNPLNFGRNLSPEEAMDLVDKREEIPKSPGKVALNGAFGSRLLDICRKRKSTRAFTGEALEFFQISNLMRSIYTLGKERSTPSAGQLYPLDIYAAVVAGDKILPRGLYRYDPAELLLNPIYGVSITPDIVARVLNSHQAERAALVIFIAADLKRPAGKYANRGYRFALMEAGHVAQNAHLYCAETKGLGMVEWGGFHDEPAAELLGLDYPKKAVLLALVVGREDPVSQPPENYFETAWELSHQLVGEGKPVKYLVIGRPSDGSYKPARVQAHAQYCYLPNVPRVFPKEICYGSGLAVTSDEAMIKALAEAYERYVSGIARVDYVGKASEMNGPWLDPREVAPLQPFAYKRHGWSKFNPKRNWQWVVGTRHNSKETVMVPVDLAFYPLSPSQFGRKLCGICTSSGVAAHTDFGIAAQKALLELVERDAVMVAWYAKREVCALPASFVSDDIQIRMQYWIKKGWRVKFLDLTLDSVPVVMALIYSERRYPSFVAGAAANPNRDIAVAKAWDEAEMFLINWKRRRRVKALAPDEVFSVLDHGMMYFKEENLSRVNWLLDAKAAKPAAPEVRNGSDLLKFFNPVVVDLTPAEPGCELKVVRTISERLLPINFGYGNEHFGHRRLKDLGLKWEREFPSFPHFFA